MSILFLASLFLSGWIFCRFVFGSVGSLQAAFAFSFCIGSILYTSLSLILACLLSSKYENTLFIALVITFSLLSLISVIYLAANRQSLLKSWVNLKSKELLPQSLSVFFCILVSYLFYYGHLRQVGDTLWRSWIFWDFTVHSPRISSFIYADNFPPLDPLFGGAPLTYHFMYHLLESIFIVSGFNYATGFNIVSVLSFACLLMLIMQFAVSMGGGYRTGYVALILFLTGSNLRFIFDIRQLSDSGWAYLSSEQFSQPFNNAILPNQWLEFYGNHFTLFYFLQERRISFGCLFMLTVLWLIIFKSDQLQKRSLALLGALIGFFFLWHFHITLLLPTIISGVVVLNFNKHKKHITTLISAAVIIFLHIAFLKNLQSDARFFSEALRDIPRLDFTLAAPHSKEESFFRIIAYIVFAYGIKLAALIAGLILIRKRSKMQFFYLFFSLLGIVIAFTLKLNTGSIFENHKWIVVSAPALNIISAFGVVRLYHFFANLILNGILPVLIKRVIFISSILVSAVLLTYSGIVENMPFFLSKPRIHQADLSANFVKHIKETFPKRAIFLTNDWQRIGPSGRSVYLSSRSHPAVGLAIEKRKEIQDQILKSNSFIEACELLIQEGITGLLYNIPERKFFYLDKLLAVDPEGYRDFIEGRFKTRILNVNKICLKE